MFTSSSNSLVGCAALLALFASNVNAHGSVQYFLNNGVKYGGPQPADQVGTVATGPIRQIFSEQPVTENLWGANSTRLACDQASNIAAPSLATVAAGSVLSVQWVNGDNEPAWPHDQGPVMTYMAACETDDCSDDPTTLSFFKIAEDGQVSGLGSAWAQASIHAGDLWNITVPKTIPSGKYIMRNEIINLINGPGNNEAYPSCFQLDVTGGSSSSTTPVDFVSSLGESQLAKFPGAYNPSDPTFSVYAVYDDDSTEAYVFPGPPVFSVSGGGNGNTTTTTTTVPSTTSHAATVTTTKPPKMTTKTKTKTKSSSLATTTSTADVMVFTTVVTKVMTLTMTVPMGNMGSGGGGGDEKHSISVHATKTKSSSSPAITTTTTTASVYDNDDCEATTTTTSGSVPTSSSPAKRHGRRSERWRAIGERS